MKKIECELGGFGVLNGNYNLHVEYTDGGYSSSTFSIATSSITNPPTSNSILTNIVMAILSLIGLVTTTIYFQKKK